MYKGVRDRGKSGVRLTYPSLDIIGAITRNPVTIDPETGVKMRKYQVVNTAEGKTETDLPVYYTINVKTKEGRKFRRGDERNARDDNMTFASETYNNPQDYTSAFGDDRIVQKTRDDGEGGDYAQDAGSVGAGLVGQNSTSGIAIPRKVGTNVTSKHVFVATRPIKVSDLAKFITRKGAANGIAGHFFFEVERQGDKPWRDNFVGLMQKLGPAMQKANGTLPATKITALGNTDVITNRQEDSVNPGVDNDYFYITEDIPTPDGGSTDWTPFLTELAKTSTGFGNADEIFGGLDDETVYALYAKCAIPVRLSRIYLSRVALGRDRTAGLAHSYNNVQNKTSSAFAKSLMAVLGRGVEAGRSYDIQNGGRMFVFQNSLSTVKFGDEVMKDNKLVKDPSISPLELEVRYVGGVIKGRGGRDMFFRLPICRERGNEGDEFVFLRYGGNDEGASEGNDNCTTPESMAAGLVVTVPEPVESIAFVAPEMEEAFRGFLSGTADRTDLSNTEVDMSDGERVNVDADTYSRKMLKNEPLKPSSKLGGAPVTQDDIDAITNGENLGATDAETARVSDKAALDDAKRSGEFIDFSQPKEVWQKKLRELDARNSASNTPQMTDDDIDQIMSDIERSRREDDRTVEPVKVGATVDGDDAGDEDPYQDKED